MRKTLGRSGEGVSSPHPLPLIVVFRAHSQFRSLRVSFWKRVLRRLEEGRSRYPHSIPPLSGASSLSALPAAVRPFQPKPVHRNSERALSPISFLSGIAAGCNTD